MASFSDRAARAFVIGDPISHSRSPLIHRHWLDRAGIAGAYDPVHVRPEELERFVADLKQGRSGFIGGNVTIPHKQDIAALVDQVDDAARQIGAVNTLWFDGDLLWATNTDSYGFQANLDDRAAGWDSGGIALVLGAGGASRAIVHALVTRGFKSIRVVNRTVGRANEIAARFGETVSAHALQDLQDAMAGASLFVNTTSLGMGGTEVPAIDFTVMTDNALVTDIVYVPLVTPIMEMARNQGLAAVDGLGMLLHQAAPGFARWFGHTPTVDEALRQLVIADMESHS